MESTFESHSGGITSWLNPLLCHFVSLFRRGWWGRDWRIKIKEKPQVGHASFHSRSSLLRKHTKTVLTKWLQPWLCPGRSRTCTPARWDRSFIPDFILQIASQDLLLFHMRAYLNLHLAFSTESAAKKSDECMAHSWNRACTGRMGYARTSLVELWTTLTRYGVQLSIMASFLCPHKMALHKERGTT